MADRRALGEEEREQPAMLVEHARRTPRQSPAHFIPTSSGAELPGCGPMSGGHPITMVQGEHLRFGCRALVASTGPEVPAVAAGLPFVASTG